MPEIPIEIPIPIGTFQVKIPIFQPLFRNRKGTVDQLNFSADTTAPLAKSCKILLILVSSY